MRRALFAFAILGALAVKTAGGELPSARAIPRTDLPPEGTRSLFDHVLEENDGLPYPFDRLIELLARYDVDGKAPAAVLVPDGRSLLKEEADYHGPRVVVAASVRQPDNDADLGHHVRGRLFLGFVEDAREIEVISYNEAAGRFEFQLVRNYAKGAVPEIVYARRSLCTACHAAEAPIFPVRPWDETNARPAIAKRILVARAVPEAQAASVLYFGVPITTRLETAETIDDLVNLANVVPVTQRIWIDGCGADPAKGVECRRLMLRMALEFARNPAGFSPKPEDRARLVELQRGSWPKEGIAVPNPGIPNRDPLDDAEAGESVADRIRGYFSRRSTEHGSFDRLRTLSHLRPELDPLTPRPPRKVLQPDTFDGVYGIAQMLSPNDRRLLEKHSAFDATKLDGAARSSKLDALLGPAPFRRAAVTRALLEALGLKGLPESSGETTDGMSPPVAEGVKPLAIAAGSALELYERYCFACHRGNPAARLDFMSGASEKEVLDKIRNVAMMRDVLDYERYVGTDKEAKLMPPKDSWQRAELEKRRAAGEKDLERMIDVVPGMFE